MARLTREHVGKAATEFLHNLKAFTVIEPSWQRSRQMIHENGHTDAWRRDMENGWKTPKLKPDLRRLFDGFRAINVQRNNLLAKLRAGTNTLIQAAVQDDLDPRPLLPFAESDPPDMQAMLPAWNMAKWLAARTGAPVDLPAPEVFKLLPLIATAKEVGGRGPVPIGRHAEPLTGNESKVLKLIQKQKPGKGILGKEILSMLAQQGTIIDESDFNGRIIRRLKLDHNVANRRGVGYYIDLHPRKTPV